MRRKAMVTVALLAIVVMLGLGCETVPVSQYDKLGVDYQNSLAHNRALQEDLDAAKRDKADLESRLAERATEPQYAAPDGTRIHDVGGQPAIQIDAALLYPSGSAKLTANGQATLTKVAELIKKQFPNHEIRVEGHTDTDPIRLTANLFDSNWDLGAKRSNEVVVFLTEKCGIDPKRVYGATFSMHRPISPDKAANRRVEIVLLPPMTPGSRVPVN